MQKSFIEEQFPISKVSKESYKERKAGASQTLTGLGKWWGRKPLVLVRATILGCLLPATDSPEKDQEVFLRLMAMDNDGLLLRKEKNVTLQELYARVKGDPALNRKYGQYFTEVDGKPVLQKGAPRDEINKAVFLVASYDDKIALGKRAEYLDNLPEESWPIINEHLRPYYNDTDANPHTIQEVVHELSMKRYGHNLIVGDCFCGGGSIPFEAARIGCNVYASDLNPIAALLTHASISLYSSTPEEIASIKVFQQKVYDAVCSAVDDMGIERNEQGDKADYYLYCTETVCPECGYRVPLSPSWVISKSTNTVAELLENDEKGFDINVEMGVSAERMKDAAKGTITDKGMVCPHCGKTTSITALRHDTKDADGNTVYGLRKWRKVEFVPAPTDVFQERLYCIRYQHTETNEAGKAISTRYYCSPTAEDLKREEQVIKYVGEHLTEWQEQGLVPSMAIDTNGIETKKPMYMRGWTYWHQLFNPRQLLLAALFGTFAEQYATTQKEKVATLLGLNKLADMNAKLCYWDKARDEGTHTFVNQALNAMFSYSARGTNKSASIFSVEAAQYFANKNDFSLSENEARMASSVCNFWITDPPYADAVQYHELTEFFLSWDKIRLQKIFPEWYTDSKRVLAVRGDNSFSTTATEIYTNLAKHMPDDGMQVVMFTHSDASVWAQLALIMWKAGLSVSAAWNIATETESGGLKQGNYVKGTVLLVLRKLVNAEEVFLDEIGTDIKAEVKRQIDFMKAIDDKEEPNFSDPDYVLAAYAASLKVLTSYKSFGDLDLDRELDLAIHDPSKSEVVKLIERAKKIAYDLIIPEGIDANIWRNFNATERFFIKGFEAEKAGSHQVSTYQEYARGFGIRNYKPLMGTIKANEARLKLPAELGLRPVSDIPEFEEGIVRRVLAAIHISVKERDTKKGLAYLKEVIPNYWDTRTSVEQLLRFFADAASIDSMGYYAECGTASESLFLLVQNDRI